MDMASSSVLQNSLRLNKEGCPPAVHPDTPAFLSRIRASLQFQTASLYRKTHNRYALPAIHRFHVRRFHIPVRYR